MKVTQQDDYYDEEMDEQEASVEENIVINMQEIKKLQNLQIMQLKENNPVNQYIEEITARKE